MQPQPVHLQELQAAIPLLTSLALGFLIGLERQRNPTAKAGVRTCALVAVFGAVAALLGQSLDTPWVLVAGLLLVGTMIITAYQASGTNPSCNACAVCQERPIPPCPR